MKKIQPLFFALFMLLTLGLHGQIDCNSINIAPSGNGISISGLNAPVTMVQAFNASWAQVFNQIYTNQPGSISIPNLANGTYFVKVDFLSASWTAICKKEQFVTTPGTGGGPLPVLSAANASVSENAGSATVTVNLSVASTSAVTLLYSTSALTALNGSDFTAVNGTLSFPAGTTSRSIVVPILDDNANEPTETFKIDFSNPSGATLADNSVTVTVNDNDAPGGGGGTPDCNAITMTAGNGSIALGGLSAPVIMVQAYNAAWSQVFNQFYTNSPGTLSIPGLPDGTYFVKVDFLNASWAALCKKEQYLTVSSNGGGTLAPVANNDATNTPQNAPVLISPLANDNLNGGTLQSLTIVSNPLNGFVSQNGTNFQYTPNAGFSGNDQFTYRINATNGQSNIGTVSIAVSAPALVPVASNDEASTNFNTAVTISPLTNDNLNGGTLLSVTVVNNPANGFVSQSGTNFVYTPNAGFSGNDQFTYRISASNGTSSAATITVAVAAQPLPPVAVNDAANTPNGTAVTVSPLANDNLNGATLQTLTIVNNPSNGTTAQVGNDFRYTPNASFSGNDQFTYRIATVNGTSNLGTVTVTVAAPLRGKNRTFDGTNNNLANSVYGSANSAYSREIPAQYGASDPNNALAGANRPSPREISNKLSDEFEDRQNARDMSGIFYQWGQFIDHDFALAEGGVESAPISVPSWDPFFSGSIAFRRNKARAGTGLNSPREQSNLQTSWVDGSQVYGTDLQRANWLRTFSKGKLKTSSGNLLPFNTTTGEFDAPIDPAAPRMDDDQNRSVKTYVAGDPRASEHPMLTSLHTLFVLEHNRLCDQFVASGMTNDEEIYQKARKEVGALIQAVTYGQWISALGVSLAPYSGYKSNVRPDVANIFATASYRWHTMVENDVIFRDNDCKGVGPVELPLKNIFNNPSIVRKQGISSLLKGGTVHQQYETDLKVNNGLRNFLLGQGSGLDLVSINIQRGRDHGLPDYNTIRKHYLGSGATAADFQSGVYSKLISLYGSLDNIDPWVGFYAENLMAGKSVGRTVDAIIRRQFEAMRDGDFYFYLNDPEFSAADRTRIQNTTLAQIIERNTSAGNFQSNIFIRKYCSADGDDLNESGQQYCSGTACQLFRDHNATSGGVNLGPGSYTQSQLASRGMPNDVISKFNVTSGFAVRIFEHDNFQGKSAYFASNSGNLDSDWNDIISSIEVICLNDNDAAVDCAGFGAFVFDNATSSGIPLTNGSYTTEQMSALSIGDNTVSRVKVSKGYTLSLYDGDHFSNLIKTVSGPAVVDLAEPTWFLLFQTSPGETNRTSSLKLSCQGSTAPVDPCSSGLAGAIAKDCNGEEISLGIGDYNSARLNAMGMPNGETEELDIVHGYVFTAFRSDNFGGSVKTYTGKHCLGLFDKPVSIRVTCLGNVPLLAKEDLTLNAEAEGSRALIKWTKSLRGTVDFYIVERFDGLKNGFAPIGKVETNGDEIESALFYDENPNEGDNLYRVTIVFADGSQESSDYDVVNFKSVGDVLVYPNPAATDFVNIDLSAYEGEAVTVEIFSAVGSKLGGFEVASANYEAAQLDISRLAPGNYMIKVQPAGKRQVMKPLVIARL